MVLNYDREFLRKPGPCAAAQMLAHATVGEKYKFASACSAPWPCASGVAGREARMQRPRVHVFVAGSCANGRDYDVCPKGVASFPLCRAASRCPADARAACVHGEAGPASKVVSARSLLARLRSTYCSMPRFVRDCRARLPRVLRVCVQDVAISTSLTICRSRTNKFVAIALVLLLGVVNSSLCACIPKELALACGLTWPCKTACAQDYRFA